MSKKIRKKKRDTKSFKKRINKRNPMTNLNTKHSVMDSLKQRMNPSFIMENLKSLEKLLHQSKEGKGSYTESITNHMNCDEFIELINKSILPDFKNGIVNEGTSMFPNIYSIEDTPIWIDGSMGSVWFDCKTTDGNFWRISLEERKFFHVEDLQYHIFRNQMSMLSKISGEPIPKREEFYNRLNQIKIMCETFTEFQLNDSKELKVHRDLSHVGLDLVNSTIKKVRDGFEYHDKEWGIGVLPRLYEDVDRLIWEFELPKRIKNSIMKLIEVSPTKGVYDIIVRG